MKRNAGAKDNESTAVYFRYTKNVAESRKPVLPRKRGRPATGRDPLVTFRLPAEAIAAIEAWSRQLPDKPSRSEALRRLVDLGMKAANVLGPRRKRG
jgi:hypothetical protein